MTEQDIIDNLAIDIDIELIPIHEISDHKIWNLTVSLFYKDKEISKSAMPISEIVGDPD